MFATFASRVSVPSPSMFVALCALVVAMGGVAAAAIPNSKSGTITACYSPSGDSFRVVDKQKGRACYADEKQLKWNRKGKPGKKGQRGITGASGVNGAVGAQGPRGTTGAPGTSAAQGDKGDKGETGTAGTNGNPGQAGTNGEPGAAGATNVTTVQNVATQIVNCTDIGMGWNCNATDTLTATCPAGQRATGGGYGPTTTGGTITESRPYPASGTPTGWAVVHTFQRYAPGPITSVEQIVYVICAAP